MNTNEYKRSDLIAESVNQSKRLSKYNIHCLIGVSLQFLAHHDIFLTNPERELLGFGLVDQAEAIYNEIHAISDGAMQEVVAVSKLKIRIKDVLISKLGNVSNLQAKENSPKSNITLKTISEINWDKWNPQLEKKLQVTAFNILTDDKNVSKADLNFQPFDRHRWKPTLGERLFKKINRLFHFVESRKNTYLSPK